jgi:hypothetical protein
VNSQRRKAPTWILPSLDVLTSLITLSALLPIAWRLPEITWQGQPFSGGIWFTVNLGGAFLMLGGGVKLLLEKVSLHLFVFLYATLNFSCQAKSSSVQNRFIKLERSGAWKRYPPLAWMIGYLLALTAFLPSHLECPKVNLDPDTPCPFVANAYTADTFQSQMKKKVPNATHHFEIGQDATLRQFDRSLTTPLDALAYIGHAPQVDDATPQQRAIGLSFFYPLTSPLSPDLAFEPFRTVIGLSFSKRTRKTLVNVDLAQWRYSTDLHAEVVDKLQTDASVMFFGACALRPSFWKPGEQSPFIQLWDLGPTTGNKGPKVMIVSNSHLKT